MSIIKTGSIAGLALLGVITYPAPCVADVWYLTLDPADAVPGIVSTPQNVISFDPDDNSVATFASPTDPPVQVDGFHRVADNMFYFSIDTHALIGGLVIAPADIVFSNTGSLSLAYDADTQGLPDGINIDAVALEADDDLLFSVDTHVELDGTIFEDADLIRFDGSGYAMAFDAATAGLPANADVNAATPYTNDRLAVSTDTGGTADGIAYGHGTVMLVDVAGSLTGIEFSVVDAIGTAADMVALSTEAVSDVIFMDGFEAE